ncbi:TetR/AcrR family transcriptional regulator [Nocardioides stalactiti]|uniref:TetR/AcrR family transcriptional regulator n=1 Tax=Nocardioides stalactiti TaxID=2755356 RepID=UPI001602338D|nr:TetR/AcrR family transcriptional regulator [Nocardioides stalactiti]
MSRDSTVPDSASKGIPERLIDAAVAMLAEEGPSAIKARTVAARAGMSSMVVYNYFGGVPELLHAVADHGFDQLGRSFALIGESDDPVADLFTMALTTLAEARANPHLYDAMFGLSTRATYRPTPTKGERRAGHSPAFNAAYAHVVAAAARLGTSGTFTIDDPTAVAGALWSFVHGYIGLDLAGHFAEFADPVRQVLLPMGVTFCVGLGADREVALASHEAALLRAWRPRA